MKIPLIWFINFKDNTMANAELLEQVNSLEWMHTIDLGGGVVTPGKWPVNQHILQAFDCIDVKGKKVLDIGACNGLWTFEAEKRGASQVYSIDYLTHVNYWCTPAYKLAYDALQSKAIYNPDLPVYDIENLGIHDFDVIIFCGVYYHLKHPLLALAKLRKVLKTGGTIIIEGPIIQDDEHCYANFLYLDTRDKSNWWIPTSRCLREWIECSFFEIVRELQDPDPEYMNTISFSMKKAVKKLLGNYEVPGKRMVIVAQGVAKKDVNYSTPDDDLIAFSM
jgi:tRNA (mo5U34)-methyltransferase